MKNISYRGFNSSALTFESNSEFQKGAPVAIGAEGACSPAEADVPFIGVCVSVRGSLITTQMEGFVETAFSGTAPSCGWVRLCADGNGGVKVTEDTDAPLYRVIEVNAENKTVGFVL